MVEHEHIGEGIKNKLRKCGENVTIHSLVTIVKPEVIEIGHDSNIADYTFIYGGKGINIGSYCHIYQLCSVIGGGEFVMGSCSGLSVGIRIITGTEDYKGGTLMSASCKQSWRNPKVGKVEVGVGAFIGTSSVILPDVTIGECAVVGALSLVNKDLEPYGIYVGSPAKKIGYRDEIKKTILEELKMEGINMFFGRNKGTVGMIYE